QLEGHAAPAVAMNYPTDWCNHYFQRRYQHIDPVVTLAPSIARPFQWTTLRKRLELKKNQQLLFDEASDAGLNNGVSVPLHGPWGRVAVMSFASRSPDSEPEAAMRRLNALASLFHVAFNDIAESTGCLGVPVQLSRRE